jgi:hypothetical protein
MNAQRESFSSTLSLISAVDGVDGCCRFTPAKRNGIHFIGGWVGPRPGLCGCEKSRLRRVLISGLSSPLSWPTLWGSEVVATLKALVTWRRIGLYVIWGFHYDELMVWLFWVRMGRKAVGLINKMPEDGIRKISRNVVSFLLYYSAS